MLAPEFLKNYDEIFNLNFSFTQSFKFKSSIESNFGSIKIFRSVFSVNLSELIKKLPLEITDLSISSFA